jgi:hypothetical protein
VQISSGLLVRLCGDRRVVRDGKRHRATTLALVELERVGVLTMASNYRVGQRGRLWSCWYRFGSGELPAAVSLPAAKWEAAQPFTTTPLVPTLALAEPKPPEAANAPTIPVLVLGERLLPTGLVRVLSDGARGLSRALLVRAPGADAPIATSSARPPWHERLWNLGPFTPGRLWASDPATVVGIPDVEVRRRMTRNERLAWGGQTLAPVIPLRPQTGLPADRAIASGGSATVVSSSPHAATAAAAPVGPPDARGEVTVVSSSPHAATAAAAPVGPPDARGGAAAWNAERLRAELAIELGDAGAAAIPLEMLEATHRLWIGFRARGRGS